MERRDFLELAGLSTIISSLSAGCMPWMRPNASVSKHFSQHQKETMEAMADTVIPYDGEPGAVQAGAWDVLKDPFYGINPWIDEIISDIDWITQLYYNKRYFKLADLEIRTIIFEDRLKFSYYKLVYEGVAAISKFAFFGGLVNEVGYKYIGFPGESQGYWPEQDLPRACK